MYTYFHVLIWITSHSPSMCLYYLAPGVTLREGISCFQSLFLASSHSKCWQLLWGIFPFHTSLQTNPHQFNRPHAQTQIYANKYQHSNPELRVGIGVIHFYGTALDSKLYKCNLGKTFILFGGLNLPSKPRSNFRLFLLLLLRSGANTHQCTQFDYRD